MSGELWVTYICNNICKSSQTPNDSWGSFEWILRWLLVPPPNATKYSVLITCCTVVCNSQYYTNSIGTERDYAQGGNGLRKMLYTECRQTQPSHHTHLFCGKPEQRWSLNCASQQRLQSPACIVHAGECTLGMVLMNELWLLGKKGERLLALAKLNNMLNYVIRHNEQLVHEVDLYLKCGSFFCFLNTCLSAWLFPCSAG